MADARSHRVAGPTQIPAVSAAFYTVPDGYTLILKTISVMNSSPTLANIVRVHVGSTSQAQRLYQTPSVPVSTAEAFDVWLVFAAGESVWLTILGGGTVYAALHGALVVA